MSFSEKISSVVSHFCIFTVGEKINYPDKVSYFYFSPTPLLPYSPTPLLPYFPTSLLPYSISAEL
ncbi:MAG: hypothetical protein SWX82_22830 [Cyanobacteriota bacterium]|nr:hypothetical protein [Cyanobacteriota bacterium]